VKYLVDIPKELFKIFGEKYGLGQSEVRVIDGVVYHIQRLTIETTGERKLPLVDGKSTITIGLFQDGVQERMTETARLMVWNHLPQVSGVEAFSIWAGIYGMGWTRTERLIPRLGNGLESVDLIVPETSFIAEVLQVAYELGKNLKPRKYSWHDNIGFVPEKEYRYG